MANEKQRHPKRKHQNYEMTQFWRWRLSVASRRASSTDISPDLTMFRMAMRCASSMLMRSLGVSRLPLTSTALSLTVRFTFRLSLLATIFFFQRSRVSLEATRFSGSPVNTFGGTTSGVSPIRSKSWRTSALLLEGGSRFDGRCMPALLFGPSVCLRMVPMAPAGSAAAAAGSSPMPMRNRSKSSSADVASTSSFRIGVSFTFPPRTSLRRGAAPAAATPDAAAAAPAVPSDTVCARTNSVADDCVDDDADPRAGAARAAAAPLGTGGAVRRTPSPPVSVPDRSRVVVVVVEDDEEDADGFGATAGPGRLGDVGRASGAAAVRTAASPLAGRGFGITLGPSFRDEPGEPSGLVPGSPPAPANRLDGGGGRSSGLSCGSMLCAEEPGGVGGRTGIMLLSSSAGGGGNGDEDLTASAQVGGGPCGGGQLGGARDPPDDVGPAPDVADGGGGGGGGSTDTFPFFRSLKLLRSAPGCVVARLLASSAFAIAAALDAIAVTMGTGALCTGTGAADTGTGATCTRTAASDAGATGAADRTGTGADVTAFVGSAFFSTGAAASFGGPPQEKENEKSNSARRLADSSASSCAQNYE